MSQIPQNLTDTRRGMVIRLVENINLVVREIDKLRHPSSGLLSSAESKLSWFSYFVGDENVQSHLSVQAQ